MQIINKLNRYGEGDEVQPIEVTADQTATFKQM